MDLSAAKLINISAILEGSSRPARGLTHNPADGEGVPQNITEGYKWVSLAATDGLTDASISKTMEKKLSPEEKAKAIQLISAANGKDGKPN